MDNSKMKMFIECTLPMTNCNMRCQYCYIPMHYSGKESMNVSLRMKLFYIK